MSNKVASTFTGTLRFLGKLLATIIILGFILVISFFSINIYILATTTDNIWQSTELEGKQAEYILVLGAGLDKNGEPSPMLAERLNKGAELLSSKAGQKILLSGDNDHAYYNEVQAMKKYLEKNGVAQENIITDPEGISTYQSVARVKDNFNAKNILIVSQKYHLYRAVYIAESYGLNAYGVPCDVRPWAGQNEYGEREFWARIKDFCQVSSRNAPQDIQKAINAIINRLDRTFRPYFE